MKKLLLISLLLNLVFVFGIAFMFLYEKQLLREISNTRKKELPRRITTYYQCKTSIFNAMRPDTSVIIFAGNSLTDQCDWAELFRNPGIINRGIGGDDIYGVRYRLDEMLRHHPSEMFLEIGINDLANDRTPQQVVHDYRLLVSEIKSKSPGLKLYIQSLLPVEDPLIVDNGVIRSLNQRLKTIAEEFGYAYIDLYTSFADEQGNLKPEFTTDGLHLNGAGYLLWKKILDPYINKPS